MGVAIFIRRHWRGWRIGQLDVGHRRRTNPGNQLASGVKLSRSHSTPFTAGQSSLPAFLTP